MHSNGKKTSKVNIIVADDHPVVALGISKMLENAPDFHLVASTATISDLFDVLKELPCDVLICDYSFEDDDEPDGLLLLDRLLRTYPKLKIILLTAHDDLVILQRAMQSGVSGFLSKVSSEFSVLPQVIRRVLDGERFVDSTTSKILIKNMLENNMHAPTLSAVALTARELEVVRLFSKGMSVTDIAQCTDRSVKTISTQKKKAMTKLGAHNDVELLNAFKQLF
ncbi:response regulator [Pseudomonas sp. CCM 7893]|uniref:Response regulator n=1 Tax=Pseudomonas spelaei TaxID=1055469 RepID=A0A6I3WJC3_9PSED|nr:response regulator transcription factor [Pseudomonas spelaei]MUF08311.1 response regulator [Pseudomonas spelaei]